VRGVRRRARKIRGERWRHRTQAGVMGVMGCDVTRGTTPGGTYLLAGNYT
jgi:hypothetical protein